MARTWALQRKILYGSGTLFALALLIGIPVYLSFFSDAPSCFDGSQNQDEAGIDCGGPCDALCDAQVADVAVLWARSFKVSDGIYNAVAYVENPNFSAGVRRVAYQFRLFDSDNLLITERTGTTFITPRMTFPVFEATIQVGNREPARTFFSFTEAPDWQKTDTTTQQALHVNERTLSNPQSEPRVFALLENRSVEVIENIEVAAVVFDTSGNAMAVSKTLIERLDGDTSTRVAFTWPRPFPRTVSRIDIIPRATPR